MGRQTILAAGNGDELDENTTQDEKDPKAATRAQSTIQFVRSFKRVRSFVL